MDHPSEQPSLKEAVACCDVAAVARLIQSGADVNPPADDGFPPLHMLVDATGRNRADALRVAELLLGAGADIEQRGINDWTPLHHAACDGNLPMVKLLVERGADVNARTRIDCHETPLMEAALTGRTEVIQYLLARGADSTLVSLAGEKAVQIAQRQGHSEAAQAFLRFGEGPA